MKKAGIIVFTLNMLGALYAGYAKADQKKVVEMEKLEITKNNQHTANWQSYIGIGIMVLGAFLMRRKKKSPTT